MTNLRSGAQPRISGAIRALGRLAVATSILFSFGCSETNDGNGSSTEVTQETFDIPSAAEPAETAGSPGVVVTNPKLLAQFGGSSFTLNRARYTRWRLAGSARPDAILILVPGFEGGASNFAILAENLILRANADGQRVEVWGFDRRSNQLEDLAGADIAEEHLDPQIALDWFFGGELGLSLHPMLAAGPNRRAQFYPSSGLGLTSVAGQCEGSVCVVGNVGASCVAPGDCSQSVNLDSSALSIGRGRRDIENLTQAAGIDVPVIAVSGTNGLATVPGVFIRFASSIGPCSAPSCDGTPRIVAATTPNPAFPTYGNVPGGFEVVVAEGFTHLDVLTAEDDVDNPIVPALAAFLARNSL